MLSLPMAPLTPALETRRGPPPSSATPFSLCAVELKVLRRSDPAWAFLQILVCTAMRSALNCRPQTVQGILPPLPPKAVLISIMSPTSSPSHAPPLLGADLGIRMGIAARCGVRGAYKSPSPEWWAGEGTGREEREEEPREAWRVVCVVLREGSMRCRGKGRVRGVRGMGE